MHFNNSVCEVSRAPGTYIEKLCSDKSVRKEEATVTPRSSTHYDIKTNKRSTKMLLSETTPCTKYSRASSMRSACSKDEDYVVQSTDTVNILIY